MAQGVPMTTEEVEKWMQDHGIAPGVISDEAGYVAGKYADPDEDPMAVLQNSLGSYMQRTLSGGDRDQGGYSTDENDPAWGNAPARTDSAGVGAAGGGLPGAPWPGLGSPGAGAPWPGLGSPGAGAPAAPGVSALGNPYLGSYPSGYVGGPMAGQPNSLQSVTALLQQLLGGGQAQGGAGGLDQLTAELQRLGVMQQGTDWRSPRGPSEGVIVDNTNELSPEGYPLGADLPPAPPGYYWKYNPATQLQHLVPDYTRNWQT